MLADVGEEHLALGQTQEFPVEPALAIGRCGGELLPRWKQRGPVNHGQFRGRSYRCAPAKFLVIGSVVFLEDQMRIGSAETETVNSSAPRGASHVFRPDMRRLGNGELRSSQGDLRPGAAEVELARHGPVLERLAQLDD